MTQLRPALVLVQLFTLLTGLAFPLGFVGVAGLIAPGPAGGSLIQRDGHVIGSALLGQNFASKKYFWPRPSATTDTDPNDATKTIPAPYNAVNSGGSNLAATSRALADRVKVDVDKLGNSPVPVDSVTTSASGLDPDISPDTALRQSARIAAARKMPVSAVRALVEANTSGRLLGLIGEPRVNVLALNLALDAQPAR